MLEAPLKAAVSENAKKPDYTFRLFAERKFYLEAKKPHVKVETDSLSSKQIRRYGFTAKLKISVLSNFEYLAIYDCSQKVEESDVATKSRIKLYHYKEYEKAFDEIRSLLGKECVYNGDFDKKWAHIEEQLKLFSVDSLFLKQINDWRLILGTEVCKHKPTLPENELNDIVQSYINSIIFLRVCEDRNLEEYKTLLNFANAKDFQALINKFQQSDKKYNSNLFNHPLNEEVIKNSGSAFWIIIKQLYYPESPYSFSVFASDILGDIYEIFLGKQLVISEGKISLEKKPEHSERDIVTTPLFIIQNILKNTIYEYCKNKTADQILSFLFADIACGSGAFLLEAYQLLNDMIIDYYLKTSPKMLIQTAVETYKLPFEIKRKILERCLHGVDKDYNAVIACKFGLLLKLLEGENNATLPVPALPDLSENIHFGNSLLDASKTPEANRRVINPYDFGKLKFDVIVGNPPYMATEHMKEYTPLELPLYKKYYSVSYKQFDKYFLFVERAIELLKDNGLLGYIVPSKFTKVGAGKNLRKLLEKYQYVQQIISFGAYQVFQDKTTYTCLLILEKKEQVKLKYSEIKDLPTWKVREKASEGFDEIDFDKLNDDGWVLVPGYLKNAFEKINKHSMPLEQLVGGDNIYNGIQTSANNIYIHTPTKQDSKYLHFTKDGQSWKIERQLTRPYFKTSSGNDNLHTYRPFSPNAFVIYPYLKKGNLIQLIPIKQLAKSYPHAYKYLLAYKDSLSAADRDIKPVPTTKNEWYRYGRHQSLDTCAVSEKIIVGVLSQGNKYAIDYHGTLISSGGTAGYCMITLPSDCEYSIYYIQAVLNSKYLEWYSSLIGEVFRGGYIARSTKVLKKLPIRRLNFESTQDKKLHAEISAIQEGLIKTQGEIDRTTSNQREQSHLKKYFASQKTKLDLALDKLFNLGADEQLIPLISKIYAAN